MLAGYRSTIFAIFVCLALTAIGLWTYRESREINGPTSYPSYTDTQQDQHNGVTEPTKGKLGQPKKRHQPCIDEQGHDASDLCANWRAADAAEKAARWAWVQMFLSSIGVVGLGITLWFNYQAWQQSRESEVDTEEALRVAKAQAEAARRQADTSEAALKNAKDSSEREIRAYVVVNNITWVDAPGSNNPLRAKIDFENVGNTPAFNAVAEHQILFVIGPSGKNEEILTALRELPSVPAMPAPSFMVLTKGDPHHNVVSTSQSAINAGPMIQAGAGFALVRGWIEYDDVFGIRRRTEYCYHCNAQTVRDRLSFTASPLGNKFT